MLQRKTLDAHGMDYVPEGLEQGSFERFANSCET